MSEAVSEEARETKGKEKELIHLFTEDLRAGNSVIPLRWCICKEAFETLRSKGVENPHLLIVVVRNDKETERKLVPLDQMMDYVYFQNPGSHRILTTIVWEEEDRVSVLKIQLLNQSQYGVYDHYVLDVLKRDFRRDREDWGDWAGDLRIHRLGQASLEVVVSKEFFAPEPAEWLKKWANLWYETKPRDQCQFRRRKIVAFTVQPPLMLAWIILNCALRFLTALFLLLWGKRARFKPVLHPFRGSMLDVWEEMLPSCQFL